MISVLAAWVIDGGTFHVQDCKADSFLMAAHEGARLHATEFAVVNSSAAGMLVSSGEVTMRASVKQRCVGYCCFDMQVAVSACLSVLGNEFLPLRYWRIRSDKFPATQAPRPAVCYCNSARLQRKETLQISSDSSCFSNKLKPKEAAPQTYCQNIQREFSILLSFQGECGQGDPFECHWLRSIDILGIRSSLALQATQCQIQIHQDPPAFPSFVEVSGVHGPRHEL